MSKQNILKHYQRAISQWPKDTLRPDVSFSAAMRSRVNRRFNLDPSSGAPSSQTSAQTSSTSSASSSTPSSPSSLNEAAELEQVNALYSFLENRYSKRYPMSNAVLEPKSNPMYYRNLMAEIEETQHRSRFAQWLHRWKGFLRWK